MTTQSRVTGRNEPAVAAPGGRGRRVAVAGRVAYAALWLGLGPGFGLGLAGGAEAAPVRILMLGDSLTAGYGLPPGQGLAPALQRWLGDHGTPATVIDAGLSGDTSYGGRVRILPALLRHRPDAVIVELGGNDMLRGWPAAASEDNLDSILQSARHFAQAPLTTAAPPAAVPDTAGRAAGGAADHRTEPKPAVAPRPVLLVGLGAPQGPAAWRQSWLAIWPRLRDRHHVALLPDLYAPLAAAPPAERRAGLQADGVHPSRKGVRAMVPPLGRAVQAMLARAPAAQGRPPR